MEANLNDQMVNCWKSWLDTVRSTVDCGHRLQNAWFEGWSNKDGFTFDDFATRQKEAFDRAPRLMERNAEVFSSFAKDGFEATSDLFKGSWTTNMFKADTAKSAGEFTDAVVKSSKAMAEHVDTAGRALADNWKEFVGSGQTSHSQSAKKAK